MVFNKAPIVLSSLDWSFLVDHLSVRAGASPFKSGRISSPARSGVGLPTLTTWLSVPHACRFYQKTPVTLEEVGLKYEPVVRDEEPTICHLAIHGGVPVSLSSVLPHADCPEWVDIIVVNDGISVERLK